MGRRRQQRRVDCAIRAAAGLQEYLLNGKSSRDRVDAMTPNDNTAAWPGGRWSGRGPSRRSPSGRRCCWWATPARALVGRRWARVLADLLTATAPVYFALFSYLSMNSFDVLIWAGVEHFD